MCPTCTDDEDPVTSNECTLSCSSLCAALYDPDFEWPDCDMSYCDDYDCGGPDLTPDSGPCEVDGYCKADGESCTSIFSDPANASCQLTTQLRCVTGRWRGNLSPTVVVPGSCSLDGGDIRDSGVTSSDAGDPVVVEDAGVQTDGGNAG